MEGAGYEKTDIRKSLFRRKGYGEKKHAERYKEISLYRTRFKKKSYHEQYFENKK